jgi:MFS family permease
MAQPGWGDLLSGANALRSFVLAGGVALHATSIYIVTTILPSVVGDIGGAEYYAWNIALFVVASIVGSALSAKLLARLGTRGAYRLAVVLFAAGALLGAIAPAMPVLLVGRCVQGLGGGVLFALSYAMIRLVFEEDLWPRAMALVSSMWGVATLLGPAFGGVFAELGTWRGAFWILLPVSGVFIVLAERVLTRSRADEAQASTSLPVLNLVLLAAAVLSVSAGSVFDNVALNAAGLVAMVLLVASFIRAEGASENRLLPRGAFGFATPLGALYLTMAMLVVGMQIEVFVPYFAQVLHGLSPLIAGYVGALMAVGWTVASMASSGAGHRGARAAVAAGPICVLAGLVGLAFAMPTRGGPATLAAIIACLLLVGFGIGLGWPHLLTRVLVVAPEADRDLAGSSITTVQLFATAFGAALTGMVANLAGMTDPGGPEGAARASTWLFGVFALAPVLAGIAARSVLARWKKLPESEDLETGSSPR